MRYIKLYEDFQLGDLNFMSPEEIQDLFFEECQKRTPDLNLIRVILDNGLVDVNAKDKYSRSPLRVAVSNDNVALAEYLISAGADVNAKDKSAMSPLHWAIEKNEVALAEYLISAGADVNVNDICNRSPLYCAVGRDNIVLVELLISAGAHVNLKSMDGNSPLHYATYRNNVTIAKLLISAGADVNAEVNHSGKSTLAVAIDNDNVEMQTLLKKHGAVE